MLKEFKEFALKGNVVDMAVGIIIGGAFGKIISSLVGDILMPPLGLLLGRVDFKSLGIHLADGKDGKPVMLGYGVFLNTVVDFVLVALAIFFLIKLMSALKPKPAPAAPAPVRTRECPQCLEAIPLKAARCKFCTSSIS